MNIRDNFVSHAASIGLGTLVNMLLGLIATPIITRLVAPIQYGQMSMFSMYANIGLMVLCLGLDQSLVRFYYDKNDLIYKQGLIKFCISIPSVATIITSFVLILISLIDSRLLEFHTNIIILLCIYIFVLIWNRMALLVLRVSYESKKYAFSNILHRLVYIVVAIVLLRKINKDQFVILIIANMVAMIIPTAYAVISARCLWNLKNNYQIVNKKEVMLFGFPFILSMGLTTVFQACDKIAISRYCSYADVGIYSSAMTLISIFAIIQTTFNALWSPLQMEHYVQNPTDTNFIRLGNKCMTVIMFFFGASLILGKDLFVFLLGEKYREAAYILPFLAFNPIMYTLSETTQGGIDFSKKSYFHIIVSAIACVTNIIGNILLVPILGCKGAAISTGVSYIVFFASRTVISKILYPVNYQLWKFWIVTLLMIIYAFYNTFFSFSWIAVFLYFILILLIAILYGKTISVIATYCYDFISKKIVDSNNTKNS